MSQPSMSSSGWGAVLGAGCWEIWVAVAMLLCGARDSPSLLCGSLLVDCEVGRLRGCLVGAVVGRGALTQL